MLSLQDAKQLQNVIIDNVRDKLPEYFPGLGSEVGQYKLCVGPLQRHRYSIIFKIFVEFGEASKNLYAKIRVPAESDYDLQVQRRKVLKEYNDLVMLWKHFQSFAGEFTISRPLDCIPECYTLITEGFVGKEVSEMIWNKIPLIRNFHESKILEKIYLCGKWLGLFHSFTREDSKAIQHKARFMELIQQSTKRCLRGNIPEALLQRVAIQLNQALEYHLMDIRQTAMIHYDYTPWNVLVSDNNIVCVLDFAWSRNGLIYEDIAYFLTACEAASFHPLSNNVHFAERLEGRFLRGYSKYIDIKPMHLNYFKAIYLYKLLANLSQSGNSLVSKYYLRAKCQYLQKRLLWHLSEGEDVISDSKLQEARSK